MAKKKQGLYNKEKRHLKSSVGLLSVFSIVVWISFFIGEIDIFLPIGIQLVFISIGLKIILNTRERIRIIDKIVSDLKNPDQDLQNRTYGKEILARGFNDWNSTRKI